MLISEPLYDFAITPDPGAILPAPGAIIFTVNGRRYDSIEELLMHFSAADYEIKRLRDMLKHEMRRAGVPYDEILNWIIVRANPGRYGFEFFLTENECEAGK